MKKTKEVFDDLTMVPPPGWKPPKAERDAIRAARGPSARTQVAQGARQVARFLLAPPDDFAPSPPPPPPQTKKDTGARPKHPK
jgi:hypothetical protein